MSSNQSQASQQCHFKRWQKVMSVSSALYCSVQGRRRSLTFIKVVPNTDDEVWLVTSSNSCHVRCNLRLVKLPLPAPISDLKSQTRQCNLDSRGSEAQCELLYQELQSLYHNSLEGCYSTRRCRCSDVLLQWGWLRVMFAGLCENRHAVMSIWLLI